MHACPATFAWVPTSGGQDGAASSITWHFGPAFTMSGVVDVALVPGVLNQSWLRPESQSRRAWSLTMAPPAEDSVRITPVPAASTGPTTNASPAAVAAPPRQGRR